MNGNNNVCRKALALNNNSEPVLLCREGSTARIVFLPLVHRLTDRMFRQAASYCKQAHELVITSDILRKLKHCQTLLADS